VTDFDKPAEHYLDKGADADHRLDLRAGWRPFSLPQQDGSARGTRELTATSMSSRACDAAVMR
jgi:hypothetical protein